MDSVLNTWQIVVCDVGYFLSWLLHIIYTWYCTIYDYQDIQLYHYPWVCTLITLVSVFCGPMHYMLEVLFNNFWSVCGPFFARGPLRPGHLAYPLTVYHAYKRHIVYYTVCHYLKMIIVCDQIYENGFKLRQQFLRTHMASRKER